MKAFALFLTLLGSLFGIAAVCFAGFGEGHSAIWSMAACLPTFICALIVGQRVA